MGVAEINEVVEVARIANLARLLKTSKEYKDQLKADLEDVNKEIKQYEEQLAAAMIEEEVQKFTQYGTTFYLTTDMRCSAVAGMQEELFSTLRDHNAGDLVKETVNGNSLKSYVKEVIAENGDELPEWLEGKINIFERSIAGTRRG